MKKRTYKPTLDQVIRDAIVVQERLRRELAEARNRQSCENGQPWVCHALATARSELAQYENVIIPSWKREEEGWRQDEKDAVEFRRVLAEQCDRLERELAEARGLLLEASEEWIDPHAYDRVLPEFADKCRAFMARIYAFLTADVSHSSQNGAGLSRTVDAEQSPLDRMADNARERLQHELFAWRNTATLAQNEEKSLRYELAEARAALASATIDTWWAKAYFKKYPEAAPSDQPLDRMADNARELGLDYTPADQPDGGEK